MKFLQKIAILCTILMTTYQISYALPRSGNNASGFSTNRSGRYAGHETSGSTSGSSGRDVRGSAALVSHNKNEKPQGSAGAAAAAGMMASQNSQDDDGSGSGSESAPTTPTAAPTTSQNSAPDQQAPMAMNEIPAIAPTNMNNAANPQLVQNSDASKDDTKNEQTPAEKEKDQATEDKETLVPDKDTILEKLKTIDLIDSKSQSLLSMSSMNQLFNNFVYFKNFIVENFPKDKMMGLAQEFINQIYPQEHVAAISMTPTSNAPKQTPTHAHDSMQQPTMDNNSHGTKTEYETDDQDTMPAQQNNNMMNAPAYQDENSSTMPSLDQDTTMQAYPSDEQVDQNQPAPVEQTMDTSNENQSNESYEAQVAENDQTNQENQSEN